MSGSYAFTNVGADVGTNLIDGHPNEVFFQIPVEAVPMSAPT